MTTVDLSHVLASEEMDLCGYEMVHSVTMTQLAILAITPREDSVVTTLGHCMLPATRHLGDLNVL